MTDTQYRQAEAIEEIKPPLMFHSADYMRRIILGPPVLRQPPMDSPWHDEPDDDPPLPQDDQPCQQC